MILIVEDNPINALVLQKMLNAQFDTRWAKNDHEAFAEVNKHPISLILMDINLGGESMDGEEIMQELRKDPTYLQLPIFAVTSYAGPGYERKFLEAGFDRYFSKPVNRQALMESIKSVGVLAS
ncbi:response regulator [Pontibacter sp. G13]|uniref:response regulator n=1 Tax=Pontibacter sp. G13 TaxID=3074898 RepID=UPI00288A5AFD|nr:response regulator [Pontibacter sp. G13]WNJ20625.1 response regulator [Pontibacter sp. G13]